MIHEKSRSIEDCCDRLLSCLRTQKVISYPLLKANGMVLAEDMISAMNLPPFPRSAMDGYAVRAEDLAGAGPEHPLALRVQGELLAGDYKEIPYQPMTAVRVMTGAYVPEGYDAVIRQEDTDYGEDQVEIYASVKPFQNYCCIGEDLKEGELVLHKNARLNPLSIASLAGVGINEVPVYAPVRVAVISTGSEIVEPGEALSPGHIYNSNAPMLAAAVESHKGTQVVMCCVIPDQEELLAAGLKTAVETADFIITTGGVCVGKRDLLPLVLEKMGAEILFKGADIQPGTPTMASCLMGKPVLSLSGNPFAALINFDIYFWEAAACMTGCDDFRTRVRRAVFRGNYPKKNTHRRMLRARLTGDEVRLPVTVHSSSVLHNMTVCNCMIDLEPGRSLQDGDEVTVRILNV